MIGRTLSHFRILAKIGEGGMVVVYRAEGLTKAHQAGVIHRDLKPDNVIVGLNGHAKILDFGLAKLLEEPAEGSDAAASKMETISGEMTREGKIFGTAAYMSPEQARGQQVDARSDIFSFGTTLYEMVMGKVPFLGKTNTDTLSAIIRDEPMPPSQQNAEIPPRLEEIIQQCLEKDPQERYLHTDQLVADLKKLKRTTDSGVQAVRTPGGPLAAAPSGRSGAVRWARRHPIVVAALGVALVVGCTSQDDPRAGVETGDDNAVVDAVFASWDLPGSPGCALAVAQDGALVYSRGYGYANLDYDIPITPQTVFDVASVNKQFVAASLSMLALEGKLSLDENVRKWLPELPEYEWPITLRHMIHHTSGLRDYLNLFPLAGRDDYYPISHAQILAMMSRQRALISPPGDHYRYSNTAYMLLAQVLKRAGGKSLGEMAQEHIFEPLGMEGSFMYENREEIIPGRATGYDRDDDGRLRIVHNYNFDVAGDGQLYSTVEDLLRWDNYLHGAEKPAIHPLMLTEGYLNNGDPIGYAQGIRLHEYRGLRTVGHSGSSWGFRTQLVRFVEPGLSIAISCNAGSANPENLAQRVADHYLADQLGPESGDEAPSAGQQVADAASEPPALTSDQLAEFAGAFFAPELDATYRFAVVDGGLVVRIEQEPPLEVAPVADDRFEIRFHPHGWSEPQPVSLEFDRNRTGAITRFGLSLGSERDIVFEKHH